jgi:PEP-CTERM motif
MWKRFQLNSSGSYSGTIGSTNLIASIPEPESLLLLGSGLLLGAGFLRRTLEKRQVA